MSTIRTLFLAATLAACSGSGPVEEAPRKPVVVALSEPAFWATSVVLADGAVDLQLLPPRGEDPGAWQPTGEQVAQAAGADVIVANGANYEAWTGTAALPAGRVVELAAEVDLIRREGKVHSHGKQGEHSHGDVDAHTWMDLTSLSEQVGRLAGILEQRYPGSTDAAAVERVKSELVAVDNEWHAALASGRFTGPPIATSHPAFGYLARRHAIPLQDFDLDPEEVPSAEQLAALEAWAGDRKVNVMWWEATPSEAVREALPSGVFVAHIDPLESGPDGAPLDLLAQARANTAVLGSSLDVFALEELRPIPDEP